MLDIIGLTVSLFNLWPKCNWCTFAVPKKTSILSVYILLYFFSSWWHLVFLRTRCTFLSKVLVGTLLNMQNCFVPNIFNCNNNTMDMAFLVEMRQSNKYGSLGNGEIINLHLVCGASPWISIPCLLVETSHIYWFHPPKQLGKNKEFRNEIQLPTNRIVLPWPIYTQARAKRGRLRTQA